MRKPAFLKVKSGIVVAMIMTLIHWLKNSLEALDASFEWYQVYGLSLSGFLGGKVWSVFTYAFLHGGWFHLLVNLLFPLGLIPRSLLRL